MLLKEVFVLTNQIASIAGAGVNTSTVVVVPAGQRIRLYRIEVSARIIAAAGEFELGIVAATGAKTLMVGEMVIANTSAGNSASSPAFVLACPSGTFVEGLTATNLVVTLTNAHATQATDDLAVNVYYELVKEP